MTGQVTSERRILMRLMVSGRGNVGVQMTAMLDTGFSGALTLPPALVTLLDLPLQTTMPVTLANGVRVALRIFEADVLWDGQHRAVLVHKSDNVPRVGLGLLYGSRVCVDILDGGELRVEPIAVPG